MITLLEFAQRTLAVYQAECIEVNTGLCSATSRTAHRYYMGSGHYPMDIDGDYLENVLDNRIAQLAGRFGGDINAGHYWPVQYTAPRIDVLRYIINELKEQEHVSESSSS